MRKFARKIAQQPANHRPLRNFSSVGLRSVISARVFEISYRTFFAAAATLRYSVARLRHLLVIRFQTFSPRPVNQHHAELLSRGIARRSSPIGGTTGDQRANIVALCKSEKQRRSSSSREFMYRGSVAVTNRASLTPSSVTSSFYLPTLPSVSGSA